MSDNGSDDNTSFNSTSGLMQPGARQPGQSVLGMVELAELSSRGAPPLQDPQDDWASFNSDAFRLPNCPLLIA